MVVVQYVCFITSNVLVYYFKKCVHIQNHLLPLGLKQSRAPAGLLYWPARACSSNAPMSRAGSYTFIGGVLGLYPSHVSK
jgi:hypothetical protein